MKVRKRQNKTRSSSISFAHPHHLQMRCICILQIYVFFLLLLLLSILNVHPLVPSYFDLISTQNEVSTLLLATVKSERRLAKEEKREKANQERDNKNWSRLVSFPSLNNQTAKSLPSLDTSSL